MVIALTATVRASLVRGALRFYPEESAQRVGEQRQADEDDAPDAKPVRTGRSTARGCRLITSSSCGSKGITKPSATDVTMLTQRTCGAVIGIVKPKKIATAMTSA